MAFVFCVLVRISVYVHALGLNLVYLVAGAGAAARFDGALIDIPR